MSVSRRGFLAGSAAAAATPPLLRPGTRTAETGVVSFGPDAVKVVLKVNGQDREVEVEPRTTLLECLRWQMGVTGPKEVCDRGACGACTVLVDGTPTLGCMSLAMDAVGKEVTTVEGIGTPENPGAVQSAFIEHDAVQCGFCIPGFVMSMEAELRRNPEATEEDLRRSVSGNLCRCGTYNKVFEAAARLAGKSPEAGFPALNNATCVETDVGRVDGPQKITGAAEYCADVRREGMLFAQHILCPYGNATLKAADVDAVRRLPGVVEAEVEIGKDCNYAGAPVGHVCAESPAAMRDALTALQLQWEVRDAQNDFARLYEEEHGAFPPSMEELTEGGRGRAAAEALQGAAVVVEQMYETQFQDHVPLEPHGATVDPGSDPVDAWVSTQGTFTCVEGVRRGYGDGKDVVVHCDYVGGGFGSKFGAGREGLLAARLAAKHKRAVRLFNNREYEHADAGNRPGSLQWMKIGAGQDGKLVGGFIRTVGITGHAGRGGVTNPSRYEFGTVASHHVNVKAPVGGSRAFRAPGHPQGMFAVDSMMDELAEALGMDPVDFRLKNDPNAVRQAMYPRGAEMIGWGQRKATGSQKGRWRTGYGLSIGDWGNRPGRCQIRMKAMPDGRVHVYSGTQDIGQGQRTVVAAIAGDALGLDRRHIEVHLADSRFPNGPASGGSSTARATAPAVRSAAETLLEELERLLGKRPGSPAEFVDLCSALPESGLEAEGEVDRKYWGDGSSETVQYAKVVVDTETGLVDVQKVIALQACGLVANRLTAENQVIGGVIQGLSYALFEEKVMDPRRGVQLNSDHEHYKIAGALDMPEIVPVLWHQHNGGGVRSLGEPPMIPTPGAIANAMANAMGTRVRSLPMTPRKVLRALEEQA